VLSLNVEGEAVEAELGRDADYPPSRAAELGRWNVLDRSDPGPRQRLYRFLCCRLRALGERERDEVLDQLRTTVTPNDAASGDRARPLTPDELVRLAGGAVAIGAHTVTHPVLSALPPARQADEIITSRRQLEEILARPVDAFAYPYGAPGDFDATTVSLVREAGFTHAYANVAGRVDGRTDRFRIPRGLVRDWSADELEQRMAAIAA
jgi:peptidoglycan/xylan/chitin deacetylase (PgdA/CDA1 family)